MRRLIMNDDVARLVRAAERMARLAQDIADRERQESAAPPAIGTVDETLLSVAPEKLIHASKRAIAGHLEQPDFGAPAIFRNPAWVLMLELFAANRSGITVSVKSASLTLGGAPSTANRMLLELERLGLIASSSDEKDARRRLLTLTSDAEAVLGDYLVRQAERHTPSMRVSLKMSHLETEDDVHTTSSSMRSSMDASTSGADSVLQ